MSELKQEVIPINLNTGIDEPMADASCFKVSSRIGGKIFNFTSSYIL